MATSDAATESLPQNTYEAIQQLHHRIQSLENQIQIERANTANVRLLIRNKLLSSQDFQPPQKTVPGYGRELALPLINVLDEADQQAFHTEFPSNGNASLIGSTPVDFEPIYFGHTHLDILSLS